MKSENTIWKTLGKIFLWLFKLAFRAFLIALYGVLKLVEMLILHFNNYLKTVIKQPINKML